MRTGFLCALTVSIALVGVIGYRARRADAAAPPRSSANIAGSAADSALSEMREELTALRAQLGGLAASQHVARQQPAPSEQAEPAPIADPTRNTEADPEEVARVVADEEQRRVERYARLESRVTSEPRDPVWAKAAEAEMANTVAQLQSSGFTGARLESTRCGSTICSAVVGYASEAERDDAARQFRPSGFRRGTVHMYEEGGQYKSIAYFAREGQDL